MTMKKSARQRGQRVPSYLCHTAHNRGFANYRDKTGKRCREYFPGPHGSAGSRGAYIRWLIEWQAEHGASNTPPTAELAGITIGVLVDRFLLFADEHYSKNGRSTGQAENCRVAVRELVQMFGDLPVGEFGPKKLKAVRAAMVKSGRMCRRTINGRVKVVRRVFKWGTEEEFVPGQVLHALQALTALEYGRTSGLRESKGVAPVADEHVDATLPHLTPTVRAMVEFAYYTGARPGEVCGFRWCDVDKSDPSAWVYRPADHKTAHLGYVRAISIGPRAQAALKPYVDIEPREHAFTPARSERERRAVNRQMADPTTFTPSRRERDRRRVDKPKRKLAPTWTDMSFRNSIHAAINQANALRIRDAIARAVEPFTATDTRSQLLEDLERIQVAALLKPPTGELRLDAERIAARVAGHVAEECLAAAIVAAIAVAADVELVPRWSPNQLRHSFETRSEDAFGLEKTSRAMGHASLGTTENYRTKLKIAAAKEVARTIG
jgi:integrase